MFAHHVAERESNSVCLNLLIETPFFLENFACA